MVKVFGAHIKVIAKTQFMIIEDKKPDNVADNPALLPYGSNVGAPAIVVNDIQFWKSPRIIHVNQQFEDKFEELKKEYEKLIEE
jgi:2',3'-cyclic-nucleotide 2'-phosphodiesterase (5'-nucleotidase family)